MITQILITGCTSGLGKKLVLKFSSQGCRVYAVGRNEALMKESFTDIELITSMLADISQEADRERIYTIIDRNQPLSIIHNAAIARPGLEEDELQLHLETNCHAPLQITRQLLPCLQEDQRVLFITSGASEMNIPGLSHYCKSKAALDQAVLELKKEWQDKKVYIASLRPGLMDTPMIECFCVTDPTILPSQDFYVQARKDNKLIPPERAANFISWVMSGTSNEEFSEKLWNIYSEEHHLKWLDSENLYIKTDRTCSSSSMKPK